MYQQYKQSIDLSTYQPYQHHFSQKRKKNYQLHNARGRAWCNKLGSGVVHNDLV
jgi:hypothetical protein